MFQIKNHKAFSMNADVTTLGPRRLFDKQRKQHAEPFRVSEVRLPSAGLAIITSGCIRNRELDHPLTSAVRQEHMRHYRHEGGEERPMACSSLGAMHAVWLVAAICFGVFSPSSASAAGPHGNVGNQYRSDTGAAIPLYGGTIPSGVGVYFEANVWDDECNTLRLEVELRKLPATFTGVANYTSNFISGGCGSPGSRARTTTASGLASGNYGWRFRIVDNGGQRTNWVLNENPDFVVAPPPCTDSQCSACQECQNNQCVSVSCGTCEQCNNNHGCAPISDCCSDDEGCGDCERCASSDRCVNVSCSSNEQCDGDHGCEPKPAICGSNGCEASETQSNCCRDCSCPVGQECVNNACRSRCGNQACESQYGESCSTCSGDCACPSGQECASGVCRNRCGNQFCDTSQGENCSNCPGDCACPSGQVCSNGSCGTACGNGSCGVGETCSTCPSDCGCPTGQECASGVCRNRCGNQFCDTSQGENCSNCPGDCACPSGQVCNNGSCGLSCGNGSCGAGENCSNCPGDCACPSGQVCSNGGCGPSCGNGSCSVGETCSTCPSDCGCPSGLACNNGNCVPSCPNGSCGAGENCSTCPSDCACPSGQVCNNGNCGPSCGNGTCGAGENCSTCPADCACPSGQVCNNGSCGRPGSIQLRVPWDDSRLDSDDYPTTYWRPQTYQNHHSGGKGARYAVDFYLSSFANCSFTQTVGVKQARIRAAHGGTVTVVPARCTVDAYRHLCGGQKWQDPYDSIEINGFDESGTVRVKTRYVHLQPTVRHGASVQPGDVIGINSDRGCACSGAHVHFEVYRIENNQALAVALDTDEVLLDGEVILEDSCSLTQPSCPTPGPERVCRYKSFPRFRGPAGQGDTDSDGIVDEFDQCPQTASDEQADDEGCSAYQRDDDADGVPNGIDMCPTTSEGILVDAEGCHVVCMDEDCDDGLFCTGSENCQDGMCMDGPPPCSADEICDEAADRCVECEFDQDCDDESFCTGPERCQNGLCIDGASPCTSSESCDEENDRCAECERDQDCDDGVFCNGEEVCDGNMCFEGENPCPADLDCNEARGVCLVTIRLTTQPERSTRSFTFDLGEMAEIEVPSPPSGMQFSHWTGDGITTNNKSDDPLRMRAESNGSITAHFEEGLIGPQLCGAAGMLSWSLLMVGLVGLRQSSGRNRRRFLAA